MSNQSNPSVAVVDPQELYNIVADVIRKELKGVLDKLLREANLLKTNGLNDKPVYTAEEVCKIFSITRQTLHTWVKEGKLTKRKIKGRVLFLNDDIQVLIHKI